MKPGKNYSLLSVACTVLVIFFVIVTISATVTEKRFFKNEHDYTDFSSGWLSENGTEVKLEKISGSCRLHKVIPQMKSHMTLIMNVRNINADVYIDDKCVYKYTKPDNAFLQTIYGKTAGSDFVDVKITKEDSGKTLYIDINCPYSNTRACKIVNVYLGNSTEIVKHSTAVQLGSFCFGIMLVFIGSVCLILYFPLRRHNVVNKSMFYLGMMSCIYGMMMITNSKLIQLVVGHETFFFTVSQMFMALLPLPLLLFFYEFYGDLNKKIINTLCIINITDCIVIFILNALGIADYNENIVVVLMIFAVSAFYIGAVTIRRMIKYKKKNIYHNIGVIILGISMLLDVVITRTNRKAESSSIMIIGLAAFSCLECIQVTFAVIEMNRKSLKAQITGKLAYYDGLTDLLNRTSFQEDMEKLEKETPENILFAVFDINDLKYVNDNFGHGSGDELIINIADAIIKSFGNMGKCYRIGGDEFVLISVSENAEEKYTEYKTIMDKLISDADSRTDYPVSVAAGYSSINGRNLKLKDVFDEADAKMYETKREMKENNSIYTQESPAY